MQHPKRPTGGKGPVASIAGLERLAGPCGTAASLLRTPDQPACAKPRARAQ